MNPRKTGQGAMLAVLAGALWLSSSGQVLPPPVPAIDAVLLPMVPASAEAASPSFRRAALHPEQKRCLAQAVYFEARGEPEEAKKAVAAVVLNRVRDPQFPDTPCDVVRQGGEKGPCQFSWWCDGRSDWPRDPNSWREALRVADLVARDPRQDPTQGALYFHREDVHPDWRTAFEPVAEIGRHIYYR